MAQRRIGLLARYLAENLPRRRILAGLSAGLTTPLLDARFAAEAACKKIGKKCDKNKDCCAGATCKGKKCACKSGLTECGGSCVDLNTDLAHCGACTTSCIDGATCQNGSCVAPSYVYVAQWGSRGSGIGEFKYPAGLALSPFGMVYVADLDNDRVQAFDASGAFLGSWGITGDQNGQFTHPLRVAVAPDEAVYVTDGSDRAQRFDIGGNFQLDWDGSGGAGLFANPRGIAIDANSDVFVADTDNHRIQKFRSNGDFLLSFGSYGSGNGEFHYPAGLAVDAGGNLYVADTLNQRVQKFDGVGTFLAAFGSYGHGEGELDNPYSVAVAPGGEIFVADTGNNRIQQLAADGSFLLAFGSAGSGDGEFTFPEGVAVRGGDVYVADTGNDRIQKFSLA